MLKVNRWRQPNEEQDFEKIASLLKTNYSKKSLLDNQRDKKIAHERLKMFENKL